MQIHVNENFSESDACVLHYFFKQHGRDTCFSKDLSVQVSVNILANMTP